jgi:hypothetical protein
MNHPTLVWICHQNQTISWLAWASRSLKPSLLEVEGGNRGHAFWYLAEMSALNQTSLLHHIFSRLHTQETRRVPVQQVHSRTTCPALPCTPVECWQVWSSLLICPSLICVQHIIGSLVQPTCCVDCFMHLTRLCMTSLWQFLDGSILLDFIYIKHEFLCIGSKPTWCVHCFMHLTGLCITSLRQLLDGSILLDFIYIKHEFLCIGSKPTCCVHCFMHLTRLCITSLRQLLDGSILLDFIHIKQEFLCIGSKRVKLQVKVQIHLSY